MMMGMMANTRDAHHGSISMELQPPLRILTAMGIVLYFVVSSTRYGKQVIVPYPHGLQYGNGNTGRLQNRHNNPEKVCRGVQPSIMAASSYFQGMLFTKPQNMNTDSPAPKPR